MDMSVFGRITDAVEVDPFGCWLWGGSVCARGFPRMYVPGGARTAVHRVAFELSGGAIPDTAELARACTVRLCVNPAHMVITPRRIAPAAPADKICTECQAPTARLRRDRCDRCYDRLWRRESKAGSTRKRGQTIKENLLSNVAAGPDGCWIYTKAPSSSTGYPNLGLKLARGMSAHRASFLAFVGPIPDGFHVDHTCHNRAVDCPGGTCLHRRCVNPDHLEAVTARDNILRSPHTMAGKWARRTHCDSGHELVENARGDRTCSTCQRDRRRERKRQVDRSARVAA